MKKTNKENPVTFFRKANEARQAVVKKSLPKAQRGFQNRADSPEEMLSAPKPIGADISVGNFSGGFKGDLDGKRISNTSFNAGYNSSKGLGINASYIPQDKKISAGVNYNTTIGRSKVPLKVGVTYNQKKGGTIKTKKK
jgi:hypothetical protein